jgi:hypothetical protein
METEQNKIERRFRETHISTASSDTGKIDKITFRYLIAEFRRFSGHAAAKSQNEQNRFKTLNM